MKEQEKIQVQQQLRGCGTITITITFHLCQIGNSLEEAGGTSE